MEVSEHMAASQPRPFKRSQVNKILREALEFFTQSKFYLPVWATWSPAQWKEQSDSAVREIFDAEMGWDITDFGRGDFDRFGLVLFTVRNGVIGRAVGGLQVLKPYCEKLMLCRSGQRTPMHFHWVKIEDIICRGGAPLLLQLYHADPKTEELDKIRSVTVSVDGIPRTVEAGGIVKLNLGESITLPQRIYHTFWADGGTTLIGEVSVVNDDNTDNRFAEPLARFPLIEEDEPPLYLLTKDYPKRFRGNL